MHRLPTGIEDLDLVLGGGLEPGSLVILAGAPGSGKTILAQQICFANASAEHKAIYYTTFAEPSAKLARHLQTFDFFDAAAFGRTVEILHLGEMVQQAGGGVAVALAEVVRECFETEPAVVVIDSTKALRDFTTEKELRSILYDLAGRVAHTRAVVLLLGEYTPEEIESSVEFSLCDGILQLVYEPREPVDRRWLRVVKLRGGDHLVGKHSFRIGRKGLAVYPRLETLPPIVPAAVAGRIVSGISGLDQLMGGGIRAGETTAVLGPSGAGKTILGLGFAARGIEDGERCLYVSLQETADQLIKTSAELGWDLGSAVRSGQLVVRHIPVGELDLDVLAAVIRRELADHTVRRVVLDSLAELVLAARETERFAAFARSLLGLIRASGASSLLTSETSTLGPMQETAGGLSFLFHNVVLLRYLEAGSELRRALNILKMRNSDHDKGVYEFHIGATGVTIGEQLSGITGVLGWSALRGQD